MDLPGDAAEIHLLGSFSVSAASAPPAAVVPPRVQSLIGYLCIHADEAVPRSQLASLLWPDSSESQAHTNLRKAIHYIKQALPECRRLLDVNSSALQLNSRAAHIDTVQFSSAVDEAEQARRDDAAKLEFAAWERAVASYRGDLLPSCYDDWVLSERARLHGHMLLALGRLAALLENRHYYRDAIRHTEQLLQHEPLHEEAYRQLMRLYALVGDRAAALQIYHRCATVLRDELDVDPAPETREAYALLMRPETGSANSGRPRLQAADRLIGRDVEWRRLQAAWRESLQGKSQVVLLSGEAGIGKTRLADEMLEWAGRQGIATARAVCYAAEGSLPFAPVAAWLSSRPLPSLEPHWLTEVARLVPHILGKFPAAEPPGPMTEPWQRNHLFEALARALLQGEDRSLLLIDNLHWCDPDTLQWLHFLLRFQPDARLLILATARPEDSNAQSAELLTALAANDQLTTLDVPRLNLQQTRDLAKELAGRELNTEEAARLFHETEGVPLFIVETLHAGFQAHGDPHSAGAGAAIPLPAKIQAIIAQRLNRLPVSSYHVLEIAAVIGREFTVDLLRLMAQVQEPVFLEALDDLWRHRLINEQSGAYDFSHDRIREVVYQGIGPDRRKWLHRLAAESLEQIASSDFEKPCAQIAAHLELADVVQRSVDYYVGAAHQARQAFATEEALKHLRRALVLNRETQRSPNLYEEQGDVLTFCQRHEQAGNSYREALIACLQEDWLRRARLHRKYAAVFSRVNNALAEHALSLAELSLRNISDRTEGYWEEWIELHLNRADASYWRWDAQAMTDLLALLQPVIETHGASVQKIAYRHCIIRRNNLRDRFRPSEETLRMARERLDLLAASRDLNRFAQGQSTLGFVLFFARQFHEAEQCLHDAAEKALKTGDHNTLLISLCYLSLTQRCLGQTEDVRSDVQALTDALAKSSITAYEAVNRANRAWLAYRSRRRAEARTLAGEAVKIWAGEAHPFPVQWPAWTILLGLASEVEEVQEAQVCLESILDPGQMLLEPEVDRSLHLALNGCRQHQADAAALCRQAVAALKEADYL